MNKASKIGAKITDKVDKISTKITNKVAKITNRVAKIGTVIGAERRKRNHHSNGYSSRSQSFASKKRIKPKYAMIKGQNTASKSMIPKPS